jgi:hypothetical protein
MTKSRERRRPRQRSQWQLFLECIRASDEHSDTRHLLLQLSRFMNRSTLRGCSMSQAQICAETGIPKSTAKRIIKAVENQWLLVERGKGYQTRNGRQNLYHGLICPTALGRLHEKERRGGSGGTPSMWEGGSGETPEGVQGGPLTEDSTPERERAHSQRGLAREGRRVVLPDNWPTAAMLAKARQDYPGATVEAIADSVRAFRIRKGDQRRTLLQWEEELKAWFSIEKRFAKRPGASFPESDQNRKDRLDRINMGEEGWARYQALKHEREAPGKRKENLRRNLLQLLQESAPPWDTIYWHGPPPGTPGCTKEVMLEAEALAAENTNFAAYYQRAVGCGDDVQESLASQAESTHSKISGARRFDTKRKKAKQVRKTPPAERKRISKDTKHAA